MKDVVRALWQWTFLLLCNIVLDLIGLFVVAATIPFRVDGVSRSDGRFIVNLPSWVRIFGNDWDGLLGDKRMWWRDNCDACVWFGLYPLLRKIGINVKQVTPDTFLAMWWWAAVRNPVNNMRLYSLWQAPVIGSTITYKGDYTVEDSPGKGGWQFVIDENGGKRWYGFYWVHEWNDKAAFVIRMGFKVKPEHAGSTTEEPKGMTTKINPYKSL